MADKMVASKFAVLTNTRAINDKSSFEGASKALLKARRILLCGIGASGLVGRDFGVERLGFAQAPERIARFQTGVEFEIGRSGFHALLDIGSVEDQRSASRAEQTARAAKQSQGRLPRADVDHVDAHDSISRRHGPAFGRCRIEQQRGGEVCPGVILAVGGDRSERLCHRRRASRAA